ncbi:hypothetical protein HQ520_09155 [bacterium]|nr:hypothetical protein [bacterium]
MSARMIVVQGVLWVALIVSVSRGEPTDLLAHVRATDDLGELRGVQAELNRQESETFLRFMISLPEPNQNPIWGWCTVPAPEGGWDLARRKTVEAEIANRGQKPLTTMLWVVASHGWGAVGDFATLEPGELRRFACDLRKTYPDGTPRLDPGQVKQVQVMLQRPDAGAVVEVRNLLATGEAPEWVRPEGRLDVPDMETGTPAAGRRVQYRLHEDKPNGAYCLLYLPEDWVAGGKFPVIVEYPGNIAYGPLCYSTGRPEQCVINYGMMKGRGSIWLSLPFVKRDREGVVENGWGDADATADYAMRAVEEICREFGGDKENVVLTGFSRGAIACGYIGLRNDRIARLWKGFHACQHYDGSGWGGSTMEGAIERAKRLAGRPVFHTDNPGENPRKVLAAVGASGTFVRSGLGFHSCAMFLDNRPSTQQLREWYANLVRSARLEEHKD